MRARRVRHCAHTTMFALFCILCAPIVFRPTSGPHARPIYLRWSMLLSKLDPLSSGRFELHFSVELWYLWEPLKLICHDVCLGAVRIRRYPQRPRKGRNVGKSRYVCTPWWRFEIPPLDGFISLRSRLIGMSCATGPHTISPLRVKCLAHSEALSFGSYRTGCHHLAHVFGAASLSLCLCMFSVHERRRGLQSVLVGEGYTGAQRGR